MRRNFIGVARSLKSAWMSGLAMLVGCFALSPQAASADPDPPVDTSRWACKFCPFDEGLSFVPELGIGYVSDDSAKFGEYSGLDDEGAYLLAGAQGRYRNPKGVWLDLSARDLGLDSRYAGIEGGVRGTLQAHMRYQELPHNISDTAVSPYLGIGTGLLTLTSGWIPAGSTGSMPALAASLHDVELETGRRLIDLGMTLTPVVHWTFGVNFRHETKTGTLGTAGTFQFNSSQLPMPVDYETDQIDVSAAYHRGRWSARLAYYGSIFTNNSDSLIWSNPYLPLVPGATAGELTLAPSNRFSQLLLSTAFRFSARTHASADLAAGRMTQDEAFAPLTLNPFLTPAPLSRSSLDGRVETLTAHLRANSAITDKFQLNGAFTYDDRDNQTPQAIYPWVTTDTALATPRTNLPYSSTHSAIRVDSAYRLDSTVRLSGGYDYDEYRRTLQEIAHSHENSAWGKLTASVGDRVQVSIKGAHAERKISDYQPVPEIFPPENPVLRKYNLADRTRDAAQFRVDFTPGERASFGVAGDIAWDNYDKSTVGLLDDRDLTLSADASFTLDANTSATVYLSRERVESNQANADLLGAVPTWFANNTDTIDTGGLSVKRRLSDRLDVALDYTLTRSRGEVRIVRATPAFPDLMSRLDSVRLYANYKLKEKLSMSLTYWYESYRSADWTLDGVGPATIGNVLSLAQGTPSYHVNVIRLSARYQF